MEKILSSILWCVVEPNRSVAEMRLIEPEELFDMAFDFRAECRLSGMLSLMGAHKPSSWLFQVHRAQVRITQPPSFHLSGDRTHQEKDIETQLSCIQGCLVS